MAVVPVFLGIIALTLGPVLLFIIWLSFKGLGPKPVNPNEKMTPQQKVNTSSVATDLFSMLRVLVGLFAIFLVVSIVVFLVVSLN